MFLCDFVIFLSLVFGIWAFAVKIKHFLESLRLVHTGEGFYQSCRLEIGEELLMLPEDVSSLGICVSPSQLKSFHPPPFSLVLVPLHRPTTPCSSGSPALAGVLLW